MPTYSYHPKLIKGINMTSKENIYMPFVVYNIAYSGNNLPSKFDGDISPSNYIGSTSIERIEKGYLGSVSSKKYKDLWEYETKHNPFHFNVEIISYHSTRKEALWKELQLQKIFNVVVNPYFVNLSLAQPLGFFGLDQKGQNLGMSTYKNKKNGSNKRLATNDPLVLSGEYVHWGIGIKRPEHSEFMKKSRLGQNKNKEQMEKSRITWIETTKDNPIRAKDWYIFRMGMIFHIKNLKKFCRDNNIIYSSFHKGSEINGYRLIKNV